MKAREAKNALEDIRENLANLDAINDAIRTFELFRFKPPTTNANDKPDYIGSILNDTYQLKNDFQHPLRTYAYLKKCYTDKNLSKYNLTDTVFKENTDVAVILRGIILAAVSQALEKEYDAKRDEMNRKILEPIMNDPKMPSDVQKAAFERVKSQGFPFSQQNNKYINNLDEFMLRVEKAIALFHLNNAINESKLPASHIDTGRKIYDAFANSKDDLPLAKEIEMICLVQQYMKNPGSDNRKAIYQLSDNIIGDYGLDNKTANNISASCFSLGVGAPKGFQVGFFTSEEKSAPETPPDTPSPIGTPRLD